MGTSCSINRGDESDCDKDRGDSPSHTSHQTPSRQPKMTDHTRKHGAQGHGHPGQFKFAFQHEMASREDESDRTMSHHAKSTEAQAKEVIARMKREDRAVFTNASVSPGQHFLDVRHLLHDTQLFHVAGMIPKGAHLHIHFNSTLRPGVLLGYAKEMANMYVWSDRRLVVAEDFENCKLEFSLRNLGQTRQGMHQKAKEASDFSMLRKLEQAASIKDDAARTRAYDELGPDIFSDSYKRGTQDNTPQVEEMRYQYFRERWEEQGYGNCDDFLISKVTFGQEEVQSFYSHGAEKASAKVGSVVVQEPTPVRSMHPNPQQPASNGTSPRPFNEQEWKIETELKISQSNYTHVRDSAREAWVAFNGRTKMMKGLFNYETAFRRYTRQCLEEFVKDNVQYAEIRPNFMQTNQILNDTAESKIDNFGTMQLIIEEYEKFMKDIGDMTDDGRIIVDDSHRPTFSGMKVIYCTPRSFSREAVRLALDECISMKKRWPGYIAGFDLVGEEAFAMLHPLEFFEEDFENFKARCERENLDIPFLFHCGETPDDLEGNLETALRLGSKRIGHGYALPEKMDVLQAMRSKNVCVETCPISNMVLGLAERMDGHAIYRLLDEKMHCAVSSDNGTIFNSTLSHDFYEVMAGHEDINIYAWKQLARWSIEHSCLSGEERRRMLREWEKRWEEFVDAVIRASTSKQHYHSISELPKMKKQAQAARLAKLRNAAGNADTAKL
ncbi:hypothetical protein F5Y14DRAFT_449052 [Nemania sp. NC0429]|nr:hypothetical protein F5Y14DRAFT_449052 [Nemania sp. NC0429]